MINYKIYSSFKNNLFHSNKYGMYWNSFWRPKTALPTVHYLAEQFIICVKCSMFIIQAIMNNRVFIIFPCSLFRH